MAGDVTRRFSLPAADRAARNDSEKERHIKQIKSERRHGTVLPGVPPSLARCQEPENGQAGTVLAAFIGGFVVDVK